MADRTLGRGNWSMVDPDLPGERAGGGAIGPLITNHSRVLTT